MFLKFKKKWIIVLVIFVAVIVILGLIISALKPTSSPNYSYCIVIDAGHGGRDGGCVGVGGTIEKEINLDYANTLKKYLSTQDVKVVMTRSNDNGLYDNNAKNKKTSDMRARENIIKNYKPDLVVSIHMNSFSKKSASGARVFYKKDSDAGKSVADLVQKSFHYYCDSRIVTASVGDYYILNCTDYTSILIECGYLSNANEEALLNTSEYREKLMHSAYMGILLYLGLFNY